MATVSELQAKLEELRAEAEALPEKIKAVVTEGSGDGKKLAALIARRDALVMLTGWDECELLEAQIASWEAERASLSVTASIARNRAIAASEAVRDAQKAHALAARDSRRVQSATSDLSGKIHDSRDRLFLLRQTIERDLAHVSTGNKQGLAPKP